MQLAQLHKVLLANYGDKEFTINLPEGYDPNNVYPYMTWLDASPKPTEAELEALLPTENVKEARRAAYPAIGDQLDAIGKALKYLADNNVDIGSDGDALVAALQQVKTSNPLP